MPAHTLTSAPAAYQENIEEDRRLYRVMAWGYVTLVPFWVLFAIVAVLSNSSTMVVYTVLNTISLVVQGFSLYAMRQVIAPNHFALPYGAGKLEDFSAFLCGVLFVPSGIYMGYVGVVGFIDPAPVAYGITLLPVVFSSVRLVALYLAVRHLARTTRRPSLLLRAYLVDYRISALSDVSVLVAFIAAWLLVGAGIVGVGERIDKALTIALSVYAVTTGISLVRHSFRPLMDLPLPEAEQLRIMKALARHYREYEDVRGVFGRMSGRQRFVLIELSFPHGTPLRDVERLRSAMKEDLAGELPGLTFTIRPDVTRT